MDKLKILKIAENQDCEALYSEDFDEPTINENYENFYNDLKQPSKYIKEDW